MRKLLYCSISLLFILCSCQQKSWEQRCVEDAQKYTLTHCPQDMGNGIFFDSLIYVQQTNTNEYYYSVHNVDNDAQLFDSLKNDITLDLIEQITNSIELKPYKEHGMNLRYIYNSTTSGQVLYDHTFTKKENGNYSE